MNRQQQTTSPVDGGSERPSSKMWSVRWSILGNDVTPTLKHFGIVQRLFSRVNLEGSGAGFFGARFSVFVVFVVTTSSWFTRV